MRYLHNALADIMRTILPVTTLDPQRDSTANTTGRQVKPWSYPSEQTQTGGCPRGTIARLGTLRVQFHDPSEHQFLAWDVTFLQDLLSDLQPSTGITASLQMRTDLWRHIYPSQQISGGWVIHLPHATHRCILEFCTLLGSTARLCN